MGYTHYWYQPVKAKITKEEWNGLTAEATKIIAAAKLDGIRLGGWDGEGAPKINTKEISFNGIGCNSHETFRLERRPKQAEYRKDDPEIFNCCKTAQKSYDAVVVSILALARDTLGDRIRVSSDGEDKAIKRVY